MRALDRSEASAALGAQAPRVPVALIAALLAAAALPRAVLAFTDQGLVWSDEIFQSLEQAHRFAFGYGLVPWEFRDGARSWLFPGAIGLLWKLIGLVHLDKPAVLIVSARLAMVALSVAAIYASLRVSARLAGPSDQTRALLWTGLFAAAFPLCVIFSFRAFTEVASAPFVIFAIWWLLEDKPRLAGVAISVATFLRYQDGLFFLGLLAWLLFQRRKQAALDFALAAAPVALACGMLDALTWGEPFLSLIHYLKINLWQGKANDFGTSPWFFYLLCTMYSTGPIAVVVFAVGLISSARRSPWLLGIAVGFVVIHSWIPHKELRFLLPAMPLFIALAGAGLARLPPKHPIATCSALGLLALLMTIRTATLRFGDIGDTDATRVLHSVWHDHEGVDRLLWSANSHPDLCGLTILQTPLWFTGGYSYLHRNVAVFFRSSEAAFASSNYIVAPVGTTLLGYHPIEKIRGEALYTREGACANAPDSYTRNF